MWESLSTGWVYTKARYYLNIIRILPDFRKISNQFILIQAYQLIQYMYRYSATPELSPERRGKVECLHFRLSMSIITRITSLIAWLLVKLWAWQGWRWGRCLADRFWWELSGIWRLWHHWNKIWHAGQSTGSDMSVINSGPKRKDYSDHSSYSYSRIAPKTHP